LRGQLAHRLSDGQRVAGAGELCQHVGHAARANRQNLDDRRGLAGQVPIHGSNPRVNRAHLAAMRNPCRDLPSHRAGRYVSPSHRDLQP
jgi:hypothetical protein